ncbi:aspartate carbamoyltransferase [Burkholderia gladioli]|uniref:aspartate carbamoyltransferase n=1 Tax=Burkholderia gladioli TaxID=28095 RepID=UPI0022D1E58D|nr:aspartate carbamoyltransferase [Burkholderia gladioli]MDA0574080.1 aspartate carbamoyltransferase [Burkholderia gladioli]MDA0602351.1 aspartate carbamoyltransferase [Burkholderia gladioli]
MSHENPRHFVSASQFSREELDQFLARSEVFKKVIASRDFTLPLKGKEFGVLFFEPSTRTRFSFESAIHRLGGNITGFADAEVSRAGVTWKESLSDTARIMNGYVDAIVFRHIEAGQLEQYLQHSTVPVINAGDGYGDESEHPTQGLLDIFTIHELFGKIDGLSILIMTFPTSRAMHSLLLYLSRFKDVLVTLCTEPGQYLPDVFAEKLRAHGLQINYAHSLDERLYDTDVLYMAGLEGAEVRPELTLTREKLMRAKPGMKILHCLPRGDELPFDIDDTPHAAYFQQAENGVPVRMAVLEYVFR